ncbi:hypothetical protein U9M48_033489 [Paspalum notatum var. saurae]|uniref:BHLH domain-containing protein n=1 Tax=Paspalum notatum var. saurae TaxID=547442 RepID=A0AAQ3U8H5_PASNO
MEAALGALCRAGGWSYAAVWRFHPHDPRLLTLAESYCEDEAKTIAENMLGEVRIEGRSSFQGNTWWQHQFLNGIKTIAVLPLQLQGLVQFGSTRKVPRSTIFVNQVRNIFDQMKNATRDGPLEYTQNHSLAYGQQPTLASVRSANDMLVHNKANPLQTETLDENIEGAESMRSSICSPSNSQRSLNDLTSHGTGNTNMDTHILAMPVNSKSICELKQLDNIAELFHQGVDVRPQLQVNSSKEDGSIVGVMSGYKTSNNLHRTENDSCDQNTEYRPYLYTTTNSSNSGLDELSYSGAGFLSSFVAISGQVKSCLQNESAKLLSEPASFSSNPCVSKVQENCVSPYHALMHEQSLVPDADPREYARFLSHGEYFLVQSDSVQLKEENTGGTRLNNNTFPELPNGSPEEVTGGTLGNNMKECSGNNSLLESMMLDFTTNSSLEDWWDDTVLPVENLSNLGEKNSESVIELANRYSLPTAERGFPFIPTVKQLVGVGAHPSAEHSSLEAEASALAGCVSDYQQPQFAFRDCLIAHSAQVPSLASSNYTSGSTQNGSSKVPPANISVDDTCSFNTENSKGSQSSNPEGMKAGKRRTRAGESTRPRPKDRQLIQDRVKELREIVPNSAKCSIDALLERTIKHMLFLQSVTKYAEKIKQVDEPKIIDKNSGIVLKDNLDGGKNGGATWAYEVAGKSMVCPIIIEDLSPPGQMLVEMLCEERGLFLEIADNIRGFGLTILKGLMELRDGKIWSRFLVEANREVTRMDIFLSLVQLLEQNNLARSTDQMAKVMSSGVPSFANHQLSPLPVPVGIVERLQ